LTPVTLPLEDAVMRRWQHLSGIVGLAGLLGRAAAGCTISIQPWTKPIPLGQTPEPPLGNPAFKAPMPNPYPPNYPLPLPNGYPPNGYPPNGYPAGAYPPNAPSAYGPSASAGNESIALLIKQMNETEDQRKVLLDQVQTLKKASRERDDNLQHASYEMEESTKQLKRTREEVRQFAGELDDLRERMRKLEDMRTALKPLIDEIMIYLEREKETPKSPRAAAAK
jgi:ABC-type transporter Mla subunit MlaD